MKYGVFGGTFDPPHVGHLAVARAVRDHLELDEIVFVPAARNPHKARRAVANSKQRLEMVRRLIEDDPTLSVSDVEVTRGGVSYAVETVEELRMVRPGDYWFVVGADAYRDLQDWKDPARLIQLCRLAVVERDKLEVEALRKAKADEFRRATDPVPFDAMPVSSSKIREDTAFGRPVSQWLTPSVEAYIQQEGLYREQV